MNQRPPMQMSGINSNYNQMPTTQVNVLHKNAHYINPRTGTSLQCFWFSTVEIFSKNIYLKSGVIKNV